MSLFVGILLAGCAGAVLRRRRVVLTALAAMYVWSWTPFTAFFAWTLERQVATPKEGAANGAIVVLSGSFYPPDGTQPEILPGYGTYLRCHHAAMLYKRGRPVPVIVTGGPVQGNAGPVDGTAAMRTVLEQEGVPAAMIWSESRSHTTYDNAANTARILREHGIDRAALVTEAFHMPRAAAAFRKQGIGVTPAPCAFRATRLEASWKEFLLPQPGNIPQNEEALHEWVGRAWYAVSRRT